VKVDPYAFARSIAYLRQQQALGPIPAAVWAESAFELGITARHLQRQFSSPATPRSAFEFKREYLIPISKFKAVKPAWEWLRSRGDIDVSYETFNRAYRQQIPPAVRVGIKSGDETKMHKAMVFGRHEVEQVNDLWSCDHGQLPMTVIGDRGKQVHPWVTVMLDEASRCIVAWAITDKTPNEEVVVATLADGLIGREINGVFVGGMPARVRVDRGADWIGRWVTKCLMTLGIHGDPAAPYSPFQKGKVERVIKTIQTSFCPLLPGADLTPKTPGRRPVGDHLDD
jgi:transposase InsO family protein